MPTLVDCQIWLFGVNGAIHKKQRNRLVSRFSVGLISTLLAPKARTKTESSVLFRTAARTRRRWSCYCRYPMQSAPNATAQKYRHGAVRLRGEASLMKDLEVRRQVLEIADQYDTLAADIDRCGNAPI
jgi:hypothetical protein